jgi:6-pyruvoyl-tetrahydropterin synthase
MFVDELTTIDFSYLDQNGGILGESLIVDVELIGSLDEQGMLMDFSAVKKDIKKAIDQTLDHSLAVPLKSKNLTINGDEIVFLSKIGKITHISPKEAITLIESKEIDLESIKKFLLQEINKILPRNITNINLKLRYEEISGQFVQYSHGLRKHKGNCQRIAHGHRSKIIITQNGKKNTEIEKWVAKFFKNSYFIDEKDIKNQFIKDNIKYISLRYQSDQGLFDLIIPDKYCHITAEETTIENLVQFIYNKVSAEFLLKNLEVKFFEGVNKGAIIFK